MTHIKNLAQIIASKGVNPIIISAGNKQSQEDAELERKLRELHFKQELRKNWILFIVKDVVIYSVMMFFLFAVSGYSLFIHIYR